MTEDNRPKFSLDPYGKVVIPFISYQADVGLFDSSTARVIPVWDWWNDEIALEDGGIDEKNRKASRAAKIKHYGIADLQLPEEEQATSLFIYQDEVGNMSWTIKHYIAGLSENLEITSGDDSFFDYYPDLWYILDQVLPSVGAILGNDELDKLAEWARQDAVNRRYFDGLHPDDFTSEFYTTLPGFTERMGNIRKQLVKRGYLVNKDQWTAEYTEKFKATNGMFEDLVNVTTI